MRSRVRSLAGAGISSLVLSWGTGLAAQDQRTAILNAERATAEWSRDSGLAGAILGRMHSDGILLWPDAPVVAGSVDLRRFLKASQIDSLQLTWQPLGIEVARDSSLGMTWGVAVASPSRKAPRPEIGNYITAWRRDGARWTIAALVFAGLRHLPKPVLGREVSVSRNPLAARGSIGPFVAADLAFAQLAADSGAAAAFERWAASDAVTFGDGGLLTRGPKAIGRAVDFPALWRWHPVAAGAAGTGDLGWTVGEATITSTGQDGGTTHSKYLTVWARRSDGAIRFLIDGGNGRPVTVDR
jgi:hypothetical protein